MDPTSALGLAAACLGIVTKLGVTINTLHNLRGKYKNSDRTISFFIIHLTTLRSASNRLSDWIEQSSLTTLSVGEKVDLQQSVDACNALVEMIDLYVSRVGKGSGPFSFGSRVRFLWDEAEIREAREILQLQVQALMFQFQIIQLPTYEERAAARASEEASVIDHARNETASLVENGERASLASESSLRTIFSGRSQGSLQFLFEATLFNSGPYKRTRERMKKPREEQSTTQIAGVEPMDSITNSNLVNATTQAVAQVESTIQLDSSATSEEMSSFKDYYGPENFHPGDVVCVLWAYIARANDEWNIERGDMLKIVGIWNDGWATGRKLTDRAEDWEVTPKDPARIKFTEKGEIKAFPIVCTCSPKYWRKTIEGDN